MPAGEATSRHARAVRAVRAVRGAVTASADTPAALHEATVALLEAIVARNALDVDDVVSAFFTVTPDLTSGFPATAARTLGWTDVPMLCAQEIPVVGALGRCVRVLLHVETTRARHELAHVYLGDAAALRPDLAVAPSAGVVGEVAAPAGKRPVSRGVRRARPRATR
jgi:chorismate mutase